MPPPWDLPDPDDEIASLTGELGAAQALLAVLPTGPDRAMVERTIEILTDRLRVLVPGPDGERSEGSST